MTGKTSRTRIRSQGGRKALSADLASRLNPGPMPSAPAPMLATLIAEPFDNPQWIFEPKFDGLRILGRFDGKNLTLLSRNNKAQNVQFPEIEKALRDSL